jgi:hypothetical protein
MLDQVAPFTRARWDGWLTFMGPRTTAINSLYAAFGSYATGC